MIAYSSGHEAPSAALNCNRVMTNKQLAAFMAGCGFDVAKGPRGDESAKRQRRRRKRLRKRGR